MSKVTITEQEQRILLILTHKLKPRLQHLLIYM